MHPISRLAKLTVIVSVGLTAQQLVAAIVYAGLVYPYEHNAHVTHLDYAHEYIYWQLRNPFAAYTPAEQMANAVSVLLVATVMILIWVESKRGAND